MTEEELENWKNVNSAKLFISKNYYHHHAFEILNTHKNLHEDFTNSLDSEIAIESRVKTTKQKKSKAIKASFLNVELRKLLDNKLKSEVKFEVNEEKGVFYFSSIKNAIGGFDFAVLDHKRNLNALRNLCFGELHYHDGIKRWNKFLGKNKDLQELADSLIDSKNLGKDINYTDYNNFKPLIVGEFQFGNWALAYRDFFKVLKANVQNSIDCLIYIVPTGNLESMLSDGIVTFDKTTKILQEFTKVVSVPVWVIGLDIK
mgnify:CR=1 FL=1